MAILAAVSESATAVAPTLEEVLDDLSVGVGGIYDIAGQGFNFVIGNPLGIVMCSLSFAGAGIGLVGRAFKTARK